MAADLSVGYKELREKKKEEEKIRRQAYFSPVTSDAKRRSSARSYEAYLHASEHDKAVSGRAPARIRGSWRAVCLAAIVMNNATGPETSITKLNMLNWIRKQRPGLAENVPEYVGMQLASLCRDKIIVSCKMPRPEGGYLTPGRKEVAYYALEGAEEMLPSFEQVLLVSFGPSPFVFLQDPY